jgi:TPR repeat protein
LNQRPFDFFLSGIQQLFDSDDPKRLEGVSKLFKASADLGDSRGMLNYGVALAKGYDGQINLRKAMKYFKKSADLGDSQGSIIMELHLQMDMMGQSIFQKQ